MKKTALFSLLIILTFSLHSIGQRTAKNLTFCKAYFSTENLLKLSMKYNDNEESFNLFILETNKAVIRAKNLLEELEPTIKAKITKEELEDLKKSIQFMNDRSTTSGSFDQSALMKLTLWFQLAENKLNPIFIKLLK